jgi:hypothetical protein
MPLLQPPHHNPHATLISLFLNAVMEMVKRTGAEGAIMSQIAPKLLKYLPVTDPVSLMNPSGAEMLRMWDARTFFLDLDKFFDL